MGTDLRQATVLSCDGARVTARTDTGVILAGPYLSIYQPQPGDRAVFTQHFDMWLAIGRIRTEPDLPTS